MGTYPKINFCLTKQLKLGVYGAVSNFNMGGKASILLFEKLNMFPGVYNQRLCNVECKNPFNVEI